MEYVTRFWGWSWSKCRALKEIEFKKTTLSYHSARAQGKDTESELNIPKSEEISRCVLGSNAVQRQVWSKDM